MALPALAIRNALQATSAEILVFDIVVNETISVLARRLHEQGRAPQLSKLLDRLEHELPLHRITWISSATQRLYPNILSLVREHNGELNFHDALIALMCRERDIHYLASFDRDFDKVPWLTRIDSPANVPQP
jgi:predicted nucleic acid-binding protein